METMCIDITTIFHALWELENRFLGPDRTWETKNPAQKELFNLYKRHRSGIPSLRHLKAKISPDWQTLNRFLQDNGFDPMFYQPLNGLGIVSILDMLIEWLVEAAIGEIAGRDGRLYEGFVIPEPGGEVFELEGLAHPLVRLRTRSGDSLWLTIPESPPGTPFELLRIPFSLQEASRRPAGMISTIQIPTVQFDRKPDISFLKGAVTFDQRGQSWIIDEAHQQFILRIDREGAHIQAATGLSVRGMISDEPQHLVFDRPFCGWFTQADAPDLPLGVFYADFDVWRPS